MEGAPLRRVPLDLFLPLPGELRVGATSPGLDGVPEAHGRSFVLADFRCGDALLLHRSLADAHPPA